MTAPELARRSVGYLLMWLGGVTLTAVVVLIAYVIASTKVWPPAHPSLADSIRFGDKVVSCTQWHEARVGPNVRSLGQLPTPLRLVADRPTVAQAHGAVDELIAAHNGLPRPSPGHIWYVRLRPGQRLSVPQHCGVSNAP